jgi:carboxypeptidase T
MKKPMIPLSFILIALLIMPSISATSFVTPVDATVMLRTVREQHLHDLQYNIPLTTPAGLYHTYDEMTELLQSLVVNHSDIMTLSSIGKTYEGRDIWLVELSDNVTKEENEPGVLFMGAHHGNEKPSYEVCIYFIEYMVEQYENTSQTEIRNAIDTTQIYIIPMVNPDGVEAGTRKNRDPNHGSFGYNTEITSIGVDLNRNFGYRWFRYFLLIPLYAGSTSFLDTSDAYRGKAPFSENETQAIKQFMETHSITIAISYHTYGNLILFPWGYTIFPAKDKPTFVSIGENISKINDYLCAQSVNLYPTVGDACDWMYGTYGVFAFTIELGDTFAPNDPEVINELCILHTNVNLYVCERAHAI